jgi:hypothetical protein
LAMNAALCLATNFSLQQKVSMTGAMEKITVQKK